MHSRAARKTSKFLDVGCGGGFLSNYLAVQGFQVTGVDLSESSLNIAREKDETKKAQYLVADAYKLPFPDRSFDIIASTDFLEHVSEPKRVLQEVARCLKPGGCFFFHTFNKNKIAEILVIKSLEWFVQNTPKDMHIIDFFIRPEDLKKWMAELEMETLQIRGIRPVFLQKPMWKLLWKGEIDGSFRFTWTKSLKVSYLGVARKA